MIRAWGGTGHSPAAPAHRIRSPRTRVTAFATGPRPVPSHRFARMIAIEGSGAGVSRSRGAVRPQALRTSVAIRTEERTERDTFIPALLALAGGGSLCVGVGSHLPCCKLRGTSAFGRDTWRCLHRDQEHYA